MPQVSGTLFEGKPIIRVTIADALPSPPGVSPRADPIPFSIRPYRALLDTGADITCLCANVIAEFRLRPYGFVRMIGSTGPSLHDTHIVRLGILCGDQSEYAGDDDQPRGLYQLEPAGGGGDQSKQLVRCHYWNRYHLAARPAPDQGWQFRILA